MSVDPLFAPLTFKRGPAWKNRFALAPMTNLQSHPDGRLGEDEFNWLVMRAKGDFGLVMTCAAHVAANGQGFPGQLGVFGDQHLEGLTRLAAAIRAHGSVSSVQLHHAGSRSPKDIVGQSLSPSDDAETGARAMTLAEVEAARDAYIAAAVRCEKAGFDGVEMHGAHGYLIAEFLSPDANRRSDTYGGSLENRARFLLEILDGARAQCRPDFQIGVRLSPERFGMRLGEVRDVVAQIMRDGKVDYVDMSLWDSAKFPEEEDFKSRKLIDWFTDIPRHGVRLGVAGQVRSSAEAVAVMEAGADFAFIGRAAMLNFDFPERVRRDPGFAAPPLPVTAAYLKQQGLGPAFIAYMRTWGYFVAD
jgi:2,4-dienoyl-CoA reductase-like NADH-dependent reductase (Old Yellow Enzyme family)